MRLVQSLKQAALASCHLLILVAVAGCVSSPARLDVAPVKAIQPGNTVAEVEKVFGPAPTKVSGANGKIVSRYIYREIQRSEDSSQYERHWRPGFLLIRTLSILYNSQGLVEKKLHDESVTPIQRTHESVEAGPLLRPDEPASIRKGETTAAELIRRYGEPMMRTLDEQGRTCLYWFYLKDRIDRLGVPVGRQLIAVLDEQQRVVETALVEENPRVWLFSGGDKPLPERNGRTEVASGRFVDTY
jgi:hypothetical protein